MMIPRRIGCRNAILFELCIMRGGGGISVLIGKWFLEYDKRLHRARETGY